MSDSSFLACDWGTTQLRAWVLNDQGNVLRRKKFPFGVSKLVTGEVAVKFRTEVRPAMEADHMPALLCGMVGSTLGWTVVPYCECPATLSHIVEGMTRVEDNPPTWIVPGVVGPGIAGAADVMRGEETQIFGWVVAAEPPGALGDHIICHPGTHSKWVLVRDGCIVRFVTTMTGELFDVLRRYTLLKDDGPPLDRTSFDEGSAAAGDGNALAARMFTLRSRQVTGRPPGSSSSYLSGLLIGAEIASISTVFGVDLAKSVVLLGEPELCRLYERALFLAGTPSSSWDGEEAVVAGLLALRMQMPRT